MTTAKPDYALRFSVEYPEGPRKRMTVLFRIFLTIPILIVLATVGGLNFGTEENSSAWTFGAGASILFLAPLLMIVFRQKYPRWWFDFNLQLTRFTTRVTSYVVLLRDEYPSTDEEQAINLDIDYPNAAENLNRWLPLVKWFLAIPHYIVLFFLIIAAAVCVVVAWFAILLTGRYPKDLFDFVVGVARWGLRVQAYAFLLATDRYPPFSLR